MVRKGENEIVTLMRVVEKGEKDKREIAIDDIISNPISCGYLLDFCQKGFCAENLNFFMAVDKYKDECGLLDFRDPESVHTCKEMADMIWADYLSLNSPNEVSLPSEDREVTMERMKNPAEYKGKLFDVATQDAIKTLHRDTLNRFLKSPQYTEMEAKIRQVHQIMSTKAFDVDGAYEIDMPTTVKLTDDRVNSKDFKLDEILGDKILFKEMLDYLEKKFKSENLKCARQIRRFEELASQKKMDDLKDFAWDVYLYFIAPGSPFEVCCTSLDRKSVQLRLGCPTKSMFDPIKENTMLVLKQDHKAFCAQIQPKTLKDRLKESKGGGQTSFLSKIRIF